VRNGSVQTGHPGQCIALRHPWLANIHQSPIMNFQSKLQQVLSLKKRTESLGVGVRRALGSMLHDPRRTITHLQE